LVHFQENVVFKEKYGYQEPFHIQNEEINILGLLFSILPFGIPIQKHQAISFGKLQRSTTSIKMEEDFILVRLLLGL
jgi:hypothetical protein